MRTRILAAFSVLTISLLGLIATSALPASAVSASTKIFLFDAPQVDLLGNFINDGLSASLQPTGSLGQLVYSPPKQPRAWIIDAALIDEVAQLALKDPVAQSWLDQLKLASAGDPILALPYGHPDLAITKRLVPTELTYYYQVSRSHLQIFFGKEVSVDKTLRWAQKGTKINSEALHTYTSSRHAVELLGSVVPLKQLESLRSQLAFIISSGSTKDQQLLFADSAQKAIAAANHKLRIVPGKYRLTSEHEKIPITLINDFSAPVTITLWLTPLNSRIKVGDPQRVTLSSNSKTQLSVPFTVIAPGSSAVLAEFRNSRGVPLGDSVILTLSLSVISPTVAWFTTGAALLLFLAAAGQVIRRVRRSRQ